MGFANIKLSYAKTYTDSYSAAIYSGNVSFGYVSRFTTYDVKNNTKLYLYFELSDSQKYILDKYWTSCKIRWNMSCGYDKYTVDNSKYNYIGHDNSNSIKTSIYSNGVYADFSGDVYSNSYTFAQDGYNDIFVELLRDSGIIAINLRALDDYVTYPSFYYRYYNAIISNIENISLDIEYEDIKSIIVPVYPIDVNVRKDKTSVFTWDVTRNHFRSSFTTISSKVIVTQGGSVSEYVAQSPNKYAEIPADSFFTGSASYYIELKDSYGGTSVSETFNFEVVGTSEAPTIINVTQDSFPTVTWESVNQKAWRLVVRGSDGVVFDSKTVAGNAQSCKLNVMLNNGSYYAEVRILNKYGYYSDWGTYGFTLEPEAPNAPTNIIISARTDFGVSVDCEAPAGAGVLYVVRRQHSSDAAIVVGEYYEGFVDYTIPINTPFEYTVRNYVSGYADGEWIDGTVNASGIVLRDGRDIKKFVNLWKVEDGEFNLISNDTRSVALVNCVGRTYPVKEISEWIFATRTVDVFVPFDVYGNLLDMATNSNVVYLQNKGEFIPCNLEIEDGGEHIEKGRITKITLTRIDEV